MVAKEPGDNHADVSRLVSATLPGGVRWRIYDRSMPTPMNFVLDRAEGRLDLMPTLVWVDGGSPELFYLRGRTPVVVWTTRYLELSALVRSVLTEESLDDLREGLAHRAALTVMSEVSLSLGRYDQAVKCLIGSLRGADWFVGSNLNDLESAPITEAYACLWFFGLAHEFGHSRNPDAFAIGSLADDAISEALMLTAGQIRVAAQNPALLDRVLTHSRGAPGSVSPGHIRGEAQADLFALEVLLDSIDPMLERATGTPGRPVHIIANLLLAHSYVSFLERCSSFVRWASTPSSAFDAAQVFIHPATFAVRQSVCRDYLAAHYAQAADASHVKRFQEWECIIDDLVDGFHAKLGALDRGLASAMRFVLDESLTIPDLMRQFAHQLNSPNGTLARGEAMHFQLAANPHHGRSPTLDALTVLLR